jgi:hypothetical protein
MARVYFSDDPYRDQPGHYFFVGLNRRKEEGQVINDSFHMRGLYQ